MTTQNQKSANAMNIINDTNHAKMVAAYIAAMQWATTDNDDNYLDRYELSDDAQQAAVIACARFLEVHGNTLETAISIHDYTYDQAGHDLFLTREGHGVGFWDRDIGHFGEVFTAYSKDIGACDPYVGGDDLIYMQE